MAAPTASAVGEPTKASPITIVPSDRYQEVDAGSDTAYLNFPTKQIMTSVDMTLAVVLWPSNVTRTVRTFEKVPEFLCVSQILATGTTMNTGYVKCYQ